MTKLLVKLFIKDSENTEDSQIRGKYGALAGIVGIICNVLLCCGKLAVGLISGSVSITADAVNNLSDASSSVVTLLGFYIAKKPADDEHPFGHARVEYISGLSVAALILIIGFQLAKSSVEKITSPEPVEFSWLMCAVLLISILVKLWMAAFNRGLGRKISSTSLIAAAADSRNDVISTAAVLATAIAAHFTGLVLDGWVGLLVALFILWSGVGIAKETISPLLGEPADPELVSMVEREILSYDPRVLGLHDLMVHDYGPGQRFASVHVEVDSRENVLDTHEMLDAIENMFREKHRIQLVIHHDPVVTDDAELNAMRSYVAEKLSEIDSGITIHDFRMVRGRENTSLIFDMVLPHGLHNREKDIQRELDEKLQHRDMKYKTVITFDQSGFNQIHEREKR